MIFEVGDVLRLLDRNSYWICSDVIHQEDGNDIYCGREEPTNSYPGVKVENYFTWCTINIDVAKAYNINKANLPSIGIKFVGRLNNREIGKLKSMIERQERRQYDFDNRIVHTDSVDPKFA